MGLEIEPLVIFGARNDTILIITPLQAPASLEQSLHFYLLDHQNTLALILSPEILVGLEISPRVA